MRYCEFTDEELNYINNTDFLNKDNDIHISSPQTIKARLPKGEYCILIDDFDDRSALCRDLKAFYNIKATPQIINENFKILNKFCNPSTSLGVVFNVPRYMEITLNFINENFERFSHIVYTLRKQAVCNGKLEQEKDLLSL